jgi:hypothetical protein
MQVPTVAVAFVLCVSACGGSEETRRSVESQTVAPPTTMAAVPDTERCNVPPRHLVELIESGLKERGMSLRHMRGAKIVDDPYGGYFVSAEVEGPGDLSGTDDIGRWYLTSDSYDDVLPSDIYSMFGFERSISRWPFPDDTIHLGLDSANTSKCVIDAMR